MKKYIGGKTIRLFLVFGFLTGASATLLAQTVPGSVEVENGENATDSIQAMKWYQKAADLGNSQADSDIGALYLEGNGVTQDKQAAMKWFKKGAAKGNAIAESNIAKMYLSGNGVPQDYHQAMKWFKRSAAKGHASAAG